MSLSHKNGIALTGLSAINGVTSISAYNGIAATLGGGGGTTYDLVTAFTPTTSTRSDFTGKLGYAFTADVGGITATQLSRWKLGGNSSTHTMRLYDFAQSQVATASVDTTSGSSGTFISATASSSIALNCGEEYIILSDEANGGDTWYDEGSSGLTVSSDMTVTKAIYNDGTFHNGTLQYYIPVSLRYTLTPTSLLSDNFQRSNSTSLGVNWTESSGDSSISSGRLLFVTASIDNSNTFNISNGSANHAVKFQIYDAGSDYFYFNFRFTNSGSPYYQVYRAPGGGWVWQKIASIGGAATSIDTQAGGSYVSGDSYGLTVFGTGSSTEIHIFRNPVADADDIISYSEWDSGDTPYVVFTADPGASSVDSGNLAGVGASQSVANTITVANYQSAEIV